MLPATSSNLYRVSTSLLSLGLYLPCGSLQDGPCSNLCDQKDLSIENVGHSHREIYLLVREHVRPCSGVRDQRVLRRPFASRGSLLNTGMGIGFSSHPYTIEISIAKRRSESCSCTYSASSRNTFIGVSGVGIYFGNRLRYGAPLSGTTKSYNFVKSEGRDYPRDFGVCLMPSSPGKISEYRL